MALEIDLISRIHLGRDLQRAAARFRDGDGAVDALFGRDPSKECEVLARRRAELQFAIRQAVIHRADPVLIRQRLALRIRY